MKISQLKNQYPLCKRYIITFCLFGYLISCGQKSNSSIDLSSIDLLPSSTTGVIITHPYYTLSYVENMEQAEWVAYDLDKSQLSNNRFKRPYFIQDKKVKSGSADWRNYKKSGYTRGHLVPAGDRKFDKKAYDNTFLTSNISPQKEDFNGGIWNRLEEKTRYWAEKYENIYVVTGGVLEPNLNTIGTEKVAVPNYFYKILFDYTEPDIKAIAFLIPHQESNKALYEFVTTIDYIEQITHIDFFPNLPDALENELESSADYKNWSFR